MGPTASFRASVRLGFAQLRPKAFEVPAGRIRTGMTNWNGGNFGSGLDYRQWVRRPKRTEHAYMDILTNVTRANLQ